MSESSCTAGSQRYMIAPLLRKMYEASAMMDDSVEPEQEPKPILSCPKVTCSAGEILRTRRASR